MIRSSSLYRLARVIIILAASIGSVLWYLDAHLENPHFTFLSGWLLLAFMLILTAYNGRKKLSFLPLVNSRVWLQFHAYLGLFTGLSFLLHLQVRWPTGLFEGVLAAAFSLVTLSGLAGWWLSRTVPKRLTTVGGEVPYERIPIVLRDLRLRSECLVLKAIPASKASTLAEFYSARLTPFFAGPSHLGPHLVGSRRPLNRLLGHLAEVRRFLTPEEKVAADELAELVRLKDALDFQRAGQLVLKSWLFLHVPFTYVLLLLTAVHVYLVYAYSGGLR